MEYSRSIARRVIVLERKLSNMEKIFNEFLEKMFPKEKVPESEKKELKNRLKELLEGEEEAVEWEEIKKLV